LRSAIYQRDSNLDAVERGRKIPPVFPHPFDGDLISRPISRVKALSLSGRLRVMVRTPSDFLQAIDWYGAPADFGGIAFYLMGPLSSYHTADCFVIDGGYSAF
jgi:hypothetical protein